MSDARQSFDFDEMGYSRKEAPMTEKLREAIAALQADDAPTERECGYQDAIDEVLRILDALAAAPQPAPETMALKGNEITLAAAYRAGQTDMKAAAMIAARDVERSGGTSGDAVAVISRLPIRVEEGGDDEQ